MSRKSFRVDVGDQSLDVSVYWRDGEVMLDVDDREIGVDVVDCGAHEVLLRTAAGQARLRVARTSRDVFVSHRGRTWRVARHYVDLDDIESTVGDLSQVELIAPMTGRVVAVPGVEGGVVEEGDTVAVVEAMKMEHQIRSPIRGVIERLNCREGDQVDLGQRLAVVVREDGPGSEEGDNR